MVRALWMVRVLVFLAPAPGARKAPAPLPVPTVTAPAIIPLPPRMPAFTPTSPVPVALPIVFVTHNAPSVNVVPPSYVLAPLRVRLPVPILVREPLDPL